MLSIKYHQLLLKETVNQILCVFVSYNQAEFHLDEKKCHKADSESTDLDLGLRIIYIFYKKKL